MKNLLTCLCFCLASFSLFSQAHLMFKIGGNFDYIETRLDDKSIEKPSPIKFVGGHFGMSMDIPLYEDILSFSPDLQFLVKSVVGEQVDAIQAEVQIPLVFSCYILPNFGVDLGPSIGYRAISLTKLGDNFEKAEGGFEELDFGISGGVRFKLNDNLMLVGRYYYGLRDVNTIFAGRKIFNRSGQISFLYSGSGRGY